MKKEARAGYLQDWCARAVIVCQGKGWPESTWTNHGENPLQNQPPLPWWELSPRRERWPDSPHHLFMARMQAVLCLAWLQLYFLAIKLQIGNKNGGLGFFLLHSISAALVASPSPPLLSLHSLLIFFFTSPSL